MSCKHRWHQPSVRNNFSVTCKRHGPLVSIAGQPVRAACRNHGTIISYAGPATSNAVAEDHPSSSCSEREPSEESRPLSQPAHSDRASMSPNTRREPQLVLPEQCEQAPTNDDSPCTSQCYGIPLGTPAAKEAAKSFWNMEMLQQSLEKIVHYSIQEGDSLSLDSIGSSIDSADVQTPPIPLSPSLPLHLSAPSSPFVSPKEERGTRPQLSPCSSPLIASSHATRKVHSATTYRLKPLLRPTFSIEGKQLKLSSRRSPKLPLRKSVSCQSFSVTKNTSDGTLTPDDGFHE